jgi:uncharacterized protein involved in propanediol utilization
VWWLDVIVHTACYCLLLLAGEKLIDPDDRDAPRATSTHTILHAALSHFCFTFRDVVGDSVRVGVVGRVLECVAVSECDLVAVLDAVWVAVAVRLRVPIPCGDTVAADGHDRVRVTVPVLDKVPV